MNLFAHHSVEHSVSSNSMYLIAGLLVVVAIFAVAVARNK